MIKSDTAAAPQSRLSRPTSPVSMKRRLGIHASASGKVGPGRPTVKERRDMVIEEKEFEPKG